MEQSQTQTPRKRKITSGSPKAGSAVDKAPAVHEGVPDKIVHRWKFTIPKCRRDPARDPEVIVLRELTSTQFEMIDKMGQTSFKRAIDSVKMSIYEVDGQVVDHSRSEADVYWGRWSSPVRGFCQVGFNKIHNSTEEEDQDFLTSMEPSF